MIESKPLARKHAVLVRLSDREQEGLDFLREREALPKAQILRRLLIREIRAGRRESTNDVGE
jgi:hypothetical protein